MASKWQLFVTTPDGKCISVDLAEGAKPLEFGRSEAVASACRLNHKYASRTHFTVSVTKSAPGVCSAVHIRQLGKNPTLLGPASVRIEAGNTHEVPAVEAAAAGEAFTHSHSVGKTTLHFPDALGMPMVHILFFGVYFVPAVTPLKVSADLSTADAVERMLTVPVLADDDDDDEAPPPSRQMRLLDEATRQQLVANAASATRAVETSAFVPSAPVSVAQRTTETRVPRVKTLVVAASATRAPQQSVEVRRDDDESMKVPRPATTAAVPHARKPAVDVPPATAAAKAPVPGAQTTMGIWEWKCHADGDDTDPKCWRRYPKATADMLEAAYRKDGGKQSVVPVDDTYVVCFDDVHMGMVQHRKDDPSRWRAVRRRGGEKVLRPHAKKRRAARDTGMTTSSSSDSDSSRPSWIVSDDESVLTSSSSDASFDTESSMLSESSDEKRKAKKRGKAKARQDKKGAAKKRHRSDDE